MSPEATKTMGVWTAIGIAIGSGLDNIGVGIAIGAGLGAAFGTFLVERDSSKNRTTDEAHR